MSRKTAQRQIERAEAATGAVTETAKRMQEYINQLERTVKQLEGGLAQLKQECVVLAAMLCKKEGGPVRISLADVQLLQNEGATIDLQTDVDARVYTLVPRKLDTVQ